MVTIPKNSHDGAAGEIFDVKTSVYHGLVSMRTQAQTLTSTSSSSVDNPYGDGRGVTVRTRSMLTKIRNRKGSWWLEPLIYFFLFGFITTLCLNFIHLHRLTFSGESNNFHNMQRRELSRPEPIDSVQDVTQEVSACLIVMDDNHFLIEWLAYHYHNANLRHLIITPDPNSRTSPSKVLDRWRDRITIEEWNETRFLSSDFEKEVHKSSYGNEKLEVLKNHRHRQQYFNLECMKELKRQNYGWTILIDSDEFLLPNENIAKNQNKTTTPSVSDVLGAINIPSGFDKIYSPCIPINRRQFSSGESSNKEIQAMVAPGFDGKDFQTMRWRKFGSKPLYNLTTWGKKCVSMRRIPNKVMIDLNRLTLEEFDGVGNPHRPLDICPENVYSHFEQTPFVLNHYMGTYKQWFYRSNDKRGVGFRTAKYEDMNERFGEKESDIIRPWLADFVAAVGSVEASRLLKDVGRLEPLPDDGKAKKNDFVKDVAKYKVGDVVEVNSGGGGVWYQAQIYSAYSNNHYSVFFDACTEEIATFDERMRPIKPE